LTILQVRVKPNAQQSKIERTEDGVWHISLQAPPVDGKANKALIKLLSETLGIPKSRIRIKTGETARYKQVEVDGEINGDQL
jgi:uncharacterized protein (TIGR00251 family)